jgi:hypothetical protein
MRKLIDLNTFLSTMFVKMTPNLELWATFLCILWFIILFTSKFAIFFEKISISRSFSPYLNYYLICFLGYCFIHSFYNFFYYIFCFFFSPLYFSNVYFVTFFELFYFYGLLELIWTYNPTNWKKLERLNWKRLYYLEL